MPGACTMGYPGALRTKHCQRPRSPRWVAIPLRVYSPIRTWKSWSRPTISGLSSAPASASATSPTPEWPPPTWPSRPPNARWRSAASRPPRSTPSSSARSRRTCSFPSTACLVQNGLGAKGAWGFDLIAACSGFVYGTTTGAHLVAAGTHKKVLVIGADTMSRIIDYTDRATCVLFGDGAGAVLIEPAEDGEDCGISSTSWAKSTARAATPSRCRPAAAACRRPTRPSTSGCTTSTRKASRYSSTPCAKCTKSAATCWSATA